MDELKPNARAVLDQAREGVEPSSEALANLGARLGLDPPPPPSPAAGTPGPDAATTPALKWALAAALVVGLGAVSAALMPSEPASTLVPTGIDLPAIAPPEPPRAPAVPAPVDEDDADEPEPQPAARPAAKRRAKASTPATGLGAELELIVRARKALAAGRDAVARRVAREYRSRFPSGSFAEEARVLDLVASCHLGKDAKVVGRAERYLAEGGSAFARRVEDACLDGE